MLFKHTIYAYYILNKFAEYMKIYNLIVIFGSYEWKNIYYLPNIPNILNVVYGIVIVESI